MGDVLVPVTRSWYNCAMANDKTHKVVYQDGLESEPLTKTEARRRKAMSHGARVELLVTKVDKKCP